MTKQLASANDLTVAGTAVAPMVWGTTYLVTTEFLPAGHPWFAALVRALPAGLLALALTRRLPQGSWWWRSLVLGALNIGLFFPLLFVAAGRLPGGVAATLGAIQPLLIAGLAAVLVGERVTAWRLGWGVAGVLGVALVVLGPTALASGMGLDPVGVLAGLGGAASMALGVVLSKRWGRPDGVGPLAYAGWLLTAGGLVLVGPALVLEGVPARIDGGAIGGYAWLGLVGGLLAYTLWFRGVRVLPAAPTALLGLLSPLTAATLGAIVLGERLTPVQLIGFALGLAALVAAQWEPSTRAAARGHGAGRRAVGVSAATASTTCCASLPTRWSGLRRGHDGRGWDGLRGGDGHVRPGATGHRR